MNLPCLPLDLLWVAMTSEVADSLLYLLTALLLEKQSSFSDCQFQYKIQVKVLDNDILHFQRDGVYQNFVVLVRNKLYLFEHIILTFFA